MSLVIPVFAGPRQRQVLMRREDVALWSLSGAFIVAILWQPVVDPFLNRAKYRSQVIDLYRAVEPGLPAADLDAIPRDKYPNLSLHLDDSGLVASAPLEFGAKNWVLHVAVADGVVATVRIRTEDGLHDHPAGAPPDKGIRARPSDGPSSGPR